MSGQPHDPRGRGRRGRAKDGGNERMPRAEPGVAHGIHQATGRGRGKWATGSPAATQPPLTLPSHATADHPCQDGGGHRVFEGAQPTVLKPDSTVTDHRHLSHHGDGEPFATPTTSVPLPACDQYEDDIHNTEAEGLRKDILIANNIPMGVAEKDIEMCFSSSKYSGGNGTVDLLEVTEGAACLQFQNDEVAANVLTFSKANGIEIQGQRVKLEYAKQQPEPLYQNDQLRIKSIPHGVDKLFLELFLENVIGETACPFNVGEITNGSVVIKFQSDLSTSELDAIISAIRSEQLSESYVEVEKCRVTTEIRVKNITSHYTEQFIKMYFTSHKTSGGGKCTCELIGENEALIKFADPTVIDSVMANMESHIKTFGDTVEVTPLTMVSSRLGIQSAANVHQSETLIISVEPLVANILKKHKDQVNSEVKHLCVNFTIDKQRSVVIVNPTALSKDGWRVECEQYFSTSYFQAMFNLTPEISHDVMNLLTTLEKDTILLYQLSQDQTQVTVAGHSSVAKSFKDDFDAIIASKSYVELSVSLESHTFEYIRQRQQGNINKEHPQVKVKYLNEENRLVLQGPAMKVQNLNDCISSLSNHASIKVDVDPAVLKFFASPSGRSRLQKRIAEIKCPIGFTLKPSSQSAVTELFLLYDPQFEGWVHRVAEDLKTEFISKSICIPKLLTSHLPSSQEYATLITKFTNNNLISGSHDSVEVIGFKQDVTDTVQAFENFFQNEQCFWNPLKLDMNELLAKAFAKNSSGLKKALKGMQLKIDINVKQGCIAVYPTQRIEGGWQEKCHTHLQSYLQLFSHSSTLSLPKSASPAIFTYLSRFEHADTVLAYEFQEEKNNVALKLAGSTDQLRQIATKMEEIRAMHENVKTTIPLPPAKVLFFSELKREEVSTLFPVIEATYNSRNNVVECSGSRHDTEQFKSYLENQTPVAIPLTTDENILQFINSPNGKNELKSFAKKHCKIAHAISFEHSSVILLCEQDASHQAKEFAQLLCNLLTVHDIQLPASFLGPSPAIYQKVGENFSNLQKEYTVLIKKEHHILHVAGFDNNVRQCSEQIQAIIRKECTVTKTIPVEKGMSRLFQSHMTDQWKTITAHCEKKEVRLEFTKDGVKILMKGEETCVEAMALDITKLLETVQSTFFPVHSPGTCKFFRNHKTRSILVGYEHQLRVAIDITEVETEIEHVAVALPAVPEVCVCTAHVPTAQGGLKEIKICTGDITEYKGDVIVNAANESLQHSGGVAKDISDKGGPKIQQACNDYIAQSFHSLDPGDVWLSMEVGKLPCKAIIHAVGPRWNGGHNNEMFYLEKACKASLRKANKSNFSSVALPAISSGIFGFPLEECASILTKTAIKFLHSEANTIKEVTFVLFSKQNATAFVDALRKHPTTARSIMSAEQPKTQPKHSPKATKQKPNKVSVPLQIEIHQGSLLSVKADVYVNTTNENLDLSQGAVAVALAKAAGPVLQEECASKAPIKCGEIAVTGPGNLPCKHVFHIVAQKYDQSLASSSEKILKSLVKKCLTEWHKRSLKSIAFPSIGGGNLGFPNEVIAQVMIETTKVFLKKKNLSGVKVHFVIFMHETLRVFKNVLSSSSLASGHKQLPPHKKTLPQKQKPQSSSVFQVGAIKVHITQGDLTNETSDAVVNTTNKDIKLEGQGVAGALLKKGGQELQNKCELAVAKEGQLQEGVVICTEATGALKCKSVFHVVFAINDPKLTIRACLLKAEALHYTSIAFPALGTGIHGYPAHEAAKQMLEAIEQFTPQNLSEIRIVLFDPNACQTFLQQFSAPENESAESSEDEFDVAVGPTIKERLVNYFWGSSEGPKTEETQQEQLYTSTTSNEGTIMVKIFGETTKLVEEAKKKVRKLIEENSIVDHVVDDTVKKLTESNITEILDKCRELEVYAEIEQGVSCIKLKGERSDVTEVIMKIQNLLQEAHVRSAHQERIISLSSVVQWKSISLDFSTNIILYSPDINYEIEMAFKQFRADNKMSSYTYSKHPVSFTIDFKAMEETDHIRQEKRRVFREDAKEIATKFKDFTPTHWDIMPLDHTTQREVLFHRVDLSDSCSEYKNVVDHFNETAVVGKDYSKIIAVKRIQRPLLFQQYMHKKLEMDRENKQDIVNERSLFHGTSQKAIEAIAYHSFDRVFAGTAVGTLYGRGCYFAVEAKYSIPYSDPDSSGNCYMLRARVLTGEYTKGAPAMMQPPPKDPTKPHKLFDSTVNDEQAPKIFVVFKDAQAYPEYLIVFRK